MDFEYDPSKSRVNRAKHGIDFEVAQRLWADPDRLMFPARSDTEERFALRAVRKLRGVLRRGILAVGKAGRPEHPRSGL